MHSAKLQQSNAGIGIRITIFISNLHCPSCIKGIQESLQALSPAPELISHSIVLHSVVLRHNPALALEDISGSLDAAGFEIHSIFQDDEVVQAPFEVRHFANDNAKWDRSLEHAVAKWFEKGAARNTGEDMHKREKHVGQCEQCRVEAGGVHLRTDDYQDMSPAKPETTITTEKVSSDVASLDGSSSLAPKSLVVVSSSQAPEVCKATIGITGMTCSACVSSITHAVDQFPWVRTVDINLLTHSGCVVFEGKNRIGEIIEAIEDAGFDATMDQVEEVLLSPLKTNGPTKKTTERWRATYAIGGMTCSVCSGAITKALDAYDWIETVDINLVSNSGSIVFLGKDHLSDITEAIEDLGYEAALDSIVPEDALRDRSIERTVAIRVDGMFCHHCPEKVTRELEKNFKKSGGLQVEGLGFSVSSPILHVRYVAAPPDFTIRHVFQSITALNPDFKPSVHHPPTIEERAREMRVQERRKVFFRLLLSVLVAIPTFLLGIVFMSLINSKHPIRRYLMQPMWAGKASRLTWALFILATPVFFLAADTFHRRAIKEIKALWRPGSRTPYLHRFLRFGSMNMLMSLGTSIAYFASVVELALAATNRSAGAMTDSYFDAVVFLTMFILIGRFLEAYSKAKTGDAVTSLGNLRPTEATLITPDMGDIKIATDLLEIGDIVRVQHGASPPFDGVVLDGSTTFDESSLTGESRPVSKSMGDMVFSGTVNKGSSVKVKITTIAGTSMLDQIINAVREGQTRRAPVERVADTITSHFVPFVVLCAILTWLIWLVLGITGGIPADWKDEGAGGWPLWSLRFAIAVFVIACPCGIGLAAPTALFVGGGLAAKHGILVRGGGEAFQEASELDCIVFDKTGTLTQGGDPAVTDHEFVGSKSSSIVLGVVQALEQHSSHPIAQALVAFCRRESAKVPETVMIDEVPGKGLKGTFKVGDGEITAIIGNEAFMADYHVPMTAQASSLLGWKMKGKSVALIATKVEPIQQSVESSTASSPTALPSNNADATTTPTMAWELAATFAIADPLRPEAPGVISQLKKRGIDVWMLSGDNPTTAAAVGAQVGILTSNIIAGVLPDQKAEKIRLLQRTLTKPPSPRLFHLPYLSQSSNPKRATVAMVGDGINDAPALSTADLSIAIGSGSDIALASSSFILITSHLGSLLTLLDLSRTVFRRVYFNFAWALVYNVVAMPVAAGVLYPITSGKPTHMDMHHNGIGMEGGMGMGGLGTKHVRLDPVWASLAMALSSVSVVCSSLLLRSPVPGVGFRARREEVGEVVMEAREEV